ncbi:hypothetical protein [Nostoc sp.]
MGRQRRGRVSRLEATVVGNARLEASGVIGDGEEKQMTNDQ